jgi:hypothetical protein
MVGWLAYESGCITLSEVGRFVNRDVGSISSAVRRLSERLQDRPELADRAKTLLNMKGLLFLILALCTVLNCR